MKKGISLAILAVTIIVLAILAGVVVVKSAPVFANVDKARLQTDIAQIEALMNTYRIRKNGNIDFEVVQFNTSTLSAAELQQFSGETISGSKIALYVIDLLEIDAEEVNYGNLKLGAKDRYLYSNVTGKVYYEKGLIVDDITHYYIVD